MNSISFQFASVISLGAADLWPNGSDIGKRGCQTIQLFAAALPFFGKLKYFFFVIVEVPSTSSNVMQFCLISGCLPNDLRSRLIEMNSLDLMVT